MSALNTRPAMILLSILGLALPALMIANGYRSEDFVYRLFSLGLGGFLLISLSLDILKAWRRKSGITLFRGVLSIWLAILAAFFVLLGAMIFKDTFPDPVMGFNAVLCACAGLLLLREAWRMAERADTDAAAPSSGNDDGPA